MTEIKEILIEIKGIRKHFEESDSPYCDTRKAMSLLGVTNSRNLTDLYKMGVLQRVPRGKGYKYKKSNCHQVAMMLDKGEIKLTTS